MVDSFCAGGLTRRASFALPHRPACRFRAAIERFLALEKRIILIQPFLKSMDDLRLAEAP
ncbi:hypothetical protein [Bosea minatitlanensis]|uniref:Uncharacterized protein n=1 Tax=Bosea minatitlanensis TaxID=128782 RepID=A0ABW0F6Z5_9HYPH|nr:hypothetical protein [Bosea minatitlanensis]MCT4493581.1 hypothetical protein [Bosea minatitlanensis]